MLCYYTNWSGYRGKAGKFTPRNIDPFLCTHILYSYAQFNKEGNVTHADRWMDVDLGETMISILDVNKLIFNTNYHCRIICFIIKQRFK